jgi:LmbE family N-acetylglucosaminyl deacetylase
MKVLVLAAHPDDEVLGVGGTILRHRAAGDWVSELVVYKCRVEPTIEQAYYWGQEHGSKPEGLEDFISIRQPDIVYTHHGGDINADHRALHEAVMVACRPYAAPSVKSIRTFHTPSSTEWGRGFTPTLYVDISEHIDAKLAAMALYESELRPEPHPRSLEYLRAQAMTWGAASGFRFAEAFQVERDRW